MTSSAPGGRFSTLLLEGLDHYRKGRMLEAVRAWEEAYLLEPTNLRAREFLRSALERIHAHMGPGARPADAKLPPGPGQHPWLPNPPVSAPPDPPSLPTPTFAMPRVPATPPPPPLEALADFGAVQITAQEAEARARTHTLPPLPSLDDLPQNPWDDGPSMAIPQPETTADEASGAWSIHKEPLPIEAVADDEVEIWMRGARELFALNDFSGALELLGKIVARKPGDKEAEQMHELCEHNLTLMYESKIGSMDARPRVAIAPDEIIWLNLDPRAGFVLAQIDGEVSFEDLYAICGLRRLDTARILCQLLEEGVVKVEGQDRAVAKRAMHRH